MLLILLFYKRSRVVVATELESLCRVVSYFRHCGILYSRSVPHEVTTDGNGETTEFRYRLFTLFGLCQAQMLPLRAAAVYYLRQTLNRPPQPPQPVFHQRAPPPNWGLFPMESLGRYRRSTVHQRPL